MHHRLHRPLDPAQTDQADLGNLLPRQPANASRNTMLASSVPHSTWTG